MTGTATSTGADRNATQRRTARSRDSTRSAGIALSRPPGATLNSLIGTQTITIYHYP